MKYRQLGVLGPRLDAHVEMTFGGTGAFQAVGSTDVRAPSGRSICAWMPV